MALTETTTFPHYIRDNACPDGLFPYLAGCRMEDNEREDNGSRDDPFLIQTFDEQTTQTLRNYLSASGAWWRPVTD